MSISIVAILISFLIGGTGLALFVGSIFLQIHLCKKENKRLGLILPSICFLFSLLAVVGMVSFYTIKTSGPVVVDDGKVVEHVIEQETNTTTDYVGAFVQGAIVFVTFNIPTLIFMLIYSSYKRKNKQYREIDKMNIQDLE